jgi:hypothetical protein
VLRKSRPISIGQEDVDGTLSEALNGCEDVVAFLGSSEGASARRCGSQRPKGSTLPEDCYGSTAAILHLRESVTFTLASRQSAA